MGFIIIYIWHHWYNLLLHQAGTVRCSGSAVDARHHCRGTGRTHCGTYLRCCASQLLILLLMQHTAAGLIQYDRVSDDATRDGQRSSCQASQGGGVWHWVGTVKMPPHLLCFCCCYRCSSKTLDDIKVLSTTIILMLHTAT